MSCTLGVHTEHWTLASTVSTAETRGGQGTRSDTHTHTKHVLSPVSCGCVSSLPVCVQPTEELSELPQRVAEISRDQRQRGGGGGALLANGTRELILSEDVLIRCLNQSRLISWNQS